MARAKFIDDPAFEAAISKAAAQFPEVAAAALRAGAAVIADEMKKRLKGVLSEDASGKLVESFGITPVKQDREFNFNVHLGFDGYQQPGYGKFTATGVPFQLIARTIESGVEGWRDATPFAKPAVQASKAQAYAAMTEAAERELEKYLKRR